MQAGQLRTMVTIALMDKSGEVWPLYLCDARLAALRRQNNHTIDQALQSSPPMLSCADAGVSMSAVAQVVTGGAVGQPFQAILECLKVCYCTHSSHTMCRYRVQLFPCWDGACVHTYDNALLCVCLTMIPIVEPKRVPCDTATKLLS